MCNAKGIIRAGRKIYKIEPRDQICQETVSQGNTSIGQGSQADRSTLKTNILASGKGNYGDIAVSQGVNVPSPDMCTRDRH